MQHGLLQKPMTPFVRMIHSSGARLNKVAVVGAAGGIGQPLSLLLKLNPRVTALALYDVAPITPGVAADLSHLPTNSKVTGHTGDGALADALKDCDVVVIPAGVPRKPGMTRDDLFNINASIVASTIAQCAISCPNAHYLIISNPVNSTVPIASEVLKAKKTYDARKLYGVTSLDLCRAETFIGEFMNKDQRQVKVPVVGGHAGKTILPLLSHTGGAFKQEDKDALTHRIMFGGDEVVQAKQGGGSATLSMAYAGARFTESVLAAIQDGKVVEEYAFVESKLGYAPFFSSKVSLDKGGVKEVHDVGALDDFEKKLFEEMKPELNAQVEKGIAFGKKYAEEKL